VICDDDVTSIMIAIAMRIAPIAIATKKARRPVAMALPREKAPAGREVTGASQSQEMPRLCGWQNHGGAILSSVGLPQPYLEMTVHKLRIRVVAATTAAPIIAEVGDSFFKGVARMTKCSKRMTLEEMEVVIASIDLMIALLRKQLQEGTNARVAADIARYQRWRDIRREAYLPRGRHLHS
jgi:hypothetical protein